MNLHAIEQMQLQRQHRVDGVGRPKFDFHTGHDGDAILTTTTVRQAHAPLALDERCIVARGPAGTDRVDGVAVV